MSLKHTVEEIDPKKAQEYLDLCTLNRPLNEAAIIQYAEDMSEGRWHPNGQPIIFNQNGKLMDGQHRMHAVILADTPVSMSVIRGVHQSAMDTLDTGRRRTTRDVLALHHEEHPKELGVAARWHWRYTKGQCLNNRSVPNQILVKHVRKHSGLRDSLEYARSLGKCRHITVGMLAAVHYITSNIHQEEADEFARGLVLGANLRLGTPLFQLRERLIESSLGSRAKKLRDDIKFALCLKAWNLTREGRSVGYIRWTKQEVFPEAK